MTTSIAFTSARATAAGNAVNLAGHRQPLVCSLSYLTASEYTLLRERVPRARAQLKICLKEALGLFSNVIAWVRTLQAFVEDFVNEHLQQPSGSFKGNRPN